MASDTPIRQGDDLPFTFDLGPDVSLEDYVCTITVKRFPGDTASPDRVIPLTEGAFTGFLTGTETAALAIGPRVLIAKLVKSSTDQATQIVEEFQVNKAWA